MSGHTPHTNITPNAVTGDIDAPLATKAPEEHAPSKSAIKPKPRRVKRKAPTGKENTPSTSKPTKEANMLRQESPPKRTKNDEIKIYVTTQKCGERIDGTKTRLPAAPFAIRNLVYYTRRALDPRAPVTKFRTRPSILFNKPKNLQKAFIISLNKLNPSSDRLPPKPIYKTLTREIIEAKAKAKATAAEGLLALRGSS